MSKWNRVIAVEISSSSQLSRMNCIISNILTESAAFAISLAFLLLLDFQYLQIGLSCSPNSIMSFCSANLSKAAAASGKYLQFLSPLKNPFNFFWQCQRQ